MRWLLALTLLLGVAHAEIAPKYYAMGQKSAPEAVTIQVKSATASVCWFNACDAREVVVTATVKSVERTQSGLKPGQVITIEYKSVPMDGRSGPRPIPGRTTCSQPNRGSSPTPSAAALARLTDGLHGPGMSKS